MENNLYIIVGEVIDKETPTFWNATNGWIVNLDLATPYNRNVLTTLPPEGTTGIMTMDMHGEPVSTYEVVPSPVGGPFFFHIPH